MMTPVVFQLYCVLRALEELERLYGTAFLLRFLEALEKPWTVKR
jgi:hypothetical protein